jgi:hypothetical protein
MNETNEKYLQQMLEGYERNMTQLDSAIEQMKSQLEGAETQKSDMVVAVSDLKELLGITDDEESEE